MAGEAKVEALIFDIEGTTTSISFVADVLFPFARKNLKSYLTAHWGEPQVVESVKGLDELAKADGTTPAPETATKEELIEHYYKQLISLMDQDRKVTPLKSLQGFIWSSGYESGELVSHVYDDVIPAFKKIHDEFKLPIYIYSSGSIAAQKLLFGHTPIGDVLPLLSGHFDTTTGMKVESSSYTKIAAALQKDPKTLLFATDALLEAEAARAASFGYVYIAYRPGNKVYEGDELARANTFPSLNNFDQLVELLQSQRS